MWLLSCHNEGGQSYRLTKEKDYYVSRTVGELILSGDQSVSRKHAVFKFTSNIENGDGLGVTITDLGSKYGTYINESKKLDALKPYLLRNGDIIKFGCQWNEWRFDSKPLIVATSTVPPEVKMSLKRVISELGGTLVNDWQETCSHLTVTNILLTAKVVSALASAVPIVTPEYWVHFQKAIEQKKLPPDHNNFIPPLKENVLNKNKVSFAVNEARRTMFAGRTFVFSTERQMNKYKTLISAAGGKSITLSDCKGNIEEVCKPNMILMQQIPSDESQHTQSWQMYNSVLELLKSNGGRPIPESEIGLAILMCSMNVYCNPQYNVVSNILQGGSMVNFSQMKSEEVLAADTPSVFGDATSVKIEETFEEKSSVDNAVAILESGSSSLHDSEGHSNRMSEKETLPFDMMMENRNSKSASATGQDKPEPQTASLRKRNASNDLTEPAAKRVLSEEVHSQESSIIAHHSLLEDFNFTDLVSSSKSRGSEAINPTNNGHSIASSNESIKRKYDDSIKAPTDDQLSKKSRTETACSMKQTIPDRPYKDPAISKSNRCLAAPEELVIQHDAGSTSKNIGSRDSKNSHLEKREKLNEGHGKELESKSVHDQNISTVCRSPISREIKEDSRALGSGLNRISSRMKEMEATAIPSTSKVRSSTVPITEKQPKTGKSDKKVEERRRIHGMDMVDMVVKMEDLVVEKPSPVVTDSNIPHHSVNFKKFKKVRSLVSRNTLPQIIGESDLIAY